ncbi:MAG: rRNA maturation RNase YbeY [Patescibacteria group bacterium]|nr:rRNA maturation RNase YbeY [Patescibacteria group bacterium]
MLEKEKEAKLFIGNVIKLLGCGPAAADVFFVSGPEIRRLNRLYRGRDKITNVLSFEAPKNFPRPEVKGKAKYLGEIYLNPGYIKKHGESQKALLTHGLLHLLGFDHETENDRIKMQKLENKISSALGY